MNIEQGLTRRQGACGGGSRAAYIAAPSVLGGVLGCGEAEAGSECAKLTPELTDGPVTRSESSRWTIHRRAPAAASMPGSMVSGNAQDGVAHRVFASFSHSPARAQMKLLCF
jgi:hypothetical protein